jgi:hypothetical protein
MNNLIRRDELCNRLGIKPQTVYNYIYRGDLVLNKHYYKPSSKLLLFDWDAIQNWMRGDPGNFEQEKKAKPEQIGQKPSEISKINI